MEANQLDHNHTKIASSSPKGFGQMFGLDPRITFLTFLVDAMLFGGEVASFGLLIVLSAIVGVVVAFVTFRAQRKWYGDDAESAFIKGVILGLLTAIPSPLPASLYVPAGVVGLVHKLLKK